MAGLGTSAAGAASAGSGGGSAAGANPFWMASNFYAEKMPTVISAQLGTSAQQFLNNPVNPGQFLRGVRHLVRSSGGIGGIVTGDAPWNTLNSIELDNVDGSQILYPMPGYSHYLATVYYRPWLGSPGQAYDFANGINPSFTLFMQNEVRHTLAVLSNTDSRSQYKYSITLNNATSVITGGTTAPTVTVTSYMDAWAQPDAKDLQGTPNEPLPPGLNVQNLRRHDLPVQLNSAGSDNVVITRAITGNELRGIIVVLRDSNGNRQDYYSDPIRWTVDNRNMGALSPDELYNWMSNFYGPAYQPRPTGVVVYSRFFKPGDLYGQGWLPTTNATKLQWEFTTATGAVNLPGTIELISDEMTPIGDIPPELDMI
jgi:hypothetical protein